MRTALIHHYFYNQGGAAAEPAVVTTEVQDRFTDDLVLSLDPSLLGMMWQEDIVTGPAITQVAADADPVGMIQDVSPNAHIINATASTLRPALGSAVGWNSFLICDGASDVFVVDGMKSCFRGMVGLTPSFSIMLKFAFGASIDGVAQVLLSSNGATGGRTGIHIAKTTGNKLTFSLTTNGAPNVTMTSKTTTADYLEADGQITLIIDVNGVGTNTLSIYKNNGVAETANVVAGYDQDFTDLLHFWKHSNNTTPRFKGNFGQCIILNRPSTEADRLWFQTYNPVRTTALKPINLHTHFDFSDTTRLFQDTAATTPAIANDDPIRLIQNPIVSTGGGVLGRDATAPSDAKRPILKTNIQNGLSGAQYDGDSTQPEAGSDMELNFTRWFKGGCWTHYLVIRNRNVTEGRKFISDGSPDLTTGTNYMTQTAEDDSSNMGSEAYGTIAGEPYYVVHPGGDTHGIKSTGRNDTINIYCVVVDGATVRVYNAAKLEKTFATTGSWFYNKLGGIAGTWTDGDWYELKRYAGAHSQAQVEAEIDALITKWGMAI